VRRNFIKPAPVAFSCPPLEETSRGFYHSQLLCDRCGNPLIQGDAVFSDRVKKNARFLVYVPSSKKRMTEVRSE
jgi:hypothetical protein